MINYKNPFEPGGAFYNPQITDASRVIEPRIMPEWVAESQEEAEKENPINFIIPEFNDISNIIKRIQLVNNIENRNLYDVNGKKQKYSFNEQDYFGNKISHKEILLPLNTRVIILGTSTKPIINNTYGTYVLCFHQNKYREGFIESSCLSKSGKVPNLDDIYSNVYNCLPSFLDDAAQIIEYSKQIL